jgi:aldehyde:ferredoxin oxidoreductase
VASDQCLVASDQKEGENTMDHYGYSGKLLRVNLESGDIRVEQPDESYYERYLGGRGIIMHTLLTEVPAKADPLGAENKLVFAMGLLTGHRVIGSGRCSVGAKSPLTGACGESEAGGWWGAELRRAGYDGIIIEGIAKKPVYLWIHNDKVEIRDASKIRGAEIRQAMEWLQEDVGEKKCRTALIGEAGEKMVSYANIIVDCRNAFGRCGMGAVMGSKRLKGVVVKGNQRPAAADNDKILELNRIMKGKYKTCPFVEYGTGGAMDASLASFGPNLLIDDPKAVCKAHEICNRFGMDTISAGATIAFAMECFENGLLNSEEMDGLQLNFGNAEVMLQLLEKIARRQGFGDLLAQGSKKAAQIIGKDSIKFAMQVKGLEIPYHEPRLNQGLSIHYGVHAAGPDHVSGAIDNVLPRLMDNWNRLHVAETLPPTELSPRKARMAYELGLLRALPNYLGLCSFVPWNISEIRDAVEAVSGWPATTWKLMKAVERGITMMRIFNLREGFKREDDRLPERFYESPQAGPLKGVKIDPDAHREAVEVYYQLLGWNRDGVPTKACLTALDLEWAAPYLEA